MQRYNELVSHISKYKKVLVAFSGGIDSYFVLKASLDALGKENVLAVTGDSPSLKQSEKDLTLKLAKTIGAGHKIIFTHELNNPDYFNNPNDRCFFCKDELYNKLDEMKNNSGFGFVLDGTNFDDLSDYRPGFKASKNHSVISPLADLKFTKTEIRELSKQLGLEIWNKPASPCLSSRIPYGQQVTTEKLEMIEKAEDLLKALGFKEYRVRHIELTGDNNIPGSKMKLAKLEIALNELDKALNKDLFAFIDENLKQFGYDFVTLDMNGLKSGSMNVQLKIPKIKSN
jgi:pyridinium-3,5-biscarboxylic acid mononucleotide sulfurtransferase